MMEWPIKTPLFPFERVFFLLRMSKLKFVFSSFPGKHLPSQLRSHAYFNPASKNLRFHSDKKKSISKIRKNDNFNKFPLETSFCTAKKTRLKYFMTFLQEMLNQNRIISDIFGARYNFIARSTTQVYRWSNLWNHGFLFSSNFRFEYLNRLQAWKKIKKVQKDTSWTKVISVVEWYQRKDCRDREIHFFSHPPKTSSTQSHSDIGSVRRIN